MISTEGTIARELRNVTDRYTDLNDIRDRIESIANKFFINGEVRQQQLRLTKCAKLDKFSI